jgi:hypothetical protein
LPSNRDSLQAELLFHGLHQTLLQLFRGVAGQNRLSSIAIHLQVFAAILESGSFLSQPPDKLTLFHVSTLGKQVVKYKLFCF